MHTIESKNMKKARQNTCDTHIPHSSLLVVPAHVIVQPRHVLLHDLTLCLFSGGGGGGDAEKSAISYLAHENLHKCQTTAPLLPT